MDFNLNDEQELFVAGIRELMASENWEVVPITGRF